MPLSRVCCLSFFMALSQFSTEWGGSRVSSSAEKLSVDLRTEVLCTITKSRFQCKIQNHRFRVVSCRNFFFSSKKIRFFAHCVKSDIIVQDMPNCFKRATEEQIDFHLIFCTDWFSCKKTGIWLLMFYARLVSQQ